MRTIRIFVSLSAILTVCAATSFWNSAVDAHTPEHRRPAHTTSKHTSRPNIPPQEIYSAIGKLYQLHFWTGQSYSLSDDANKQAIIAFQKLNGLSRTGTLNDSTYTMILRAAPIGPKETMHENHIEVDIDRQVLFVVDSADRVKLILPVSTATGDKFQQDGKGEQIAKTPTGKFRIFNKVDGWKQSDLGLMYDPLYFSGGYAIHGDPAVPPKPASHGCVRIPMFAAQWMFAATRIGTPVFIYGTNPDHPNRRMAGSKHEQ